MSLISLEEARARVLSGVAPLGAVTVPLQDAAGAVLATRVTAYRDQPPQPLSAMDGYAIREADLEAGRFTVIGAAPAGQPFTGAVGPGEAVRIFTGAVVPEGADRILVQEIVTVAGDIATLTQSPGDARYVRPAGLDFRKDDVLLQPGVRLGPGQIALAAAANRAALHVHRRPHIALVSTGDELVAPGGAPDDTRIIDAASHGVAALLSGWGAGTVQHAHVPDDADAVTREARRLIAEADLIVTIGGASVGAHDVVRRSFDAAGAAMAFAGVAVRPGKPFWHARAEGALVVGLPGNPASALVTARLLLAPLVARLQGLEAADAIQTRTARLTGALSSPGGRETWHRGALQAGRVVVDLRDDSSLLRPFANADILVRQPAHTPLNAGSAVEYLPFETLGF